METMSLESPLVTIGRDLNRKSPPAFTETDFLCGYSQSHFNLPT